MRIQIWSIYYDPVPLGIGPAATGLARQLASRGHDVSVVTSHPHYPAPEWGAGMLPRLERRDGIRVLELPVYPHRTKPWQRMLAEATYGTGQLLAALQPLRADVVIAVVPSLMVVPGAILASRLWRVPMVLWLQDIVSSAARATGLVEPGNISRGIRLLERLAYRRSERIITITDSFHQHLLSSGVAPGKLERIYSSSALPAEPPLGPGDSNTALVIGNIGLTQNLAGVATAFQHSPELRAIGAKLRVTGDGVAVHALRGAIDGPDVEMLGIVSRERLTEELRSARIALVTQLPRVVGFNLPSKISTYMSHGVPIFAIVDPDSEAAELVRRSGAGWVADSGDLPRACVELAERFSAQEELERASTAGVEFARANFHPEVVTGRYEAVLEGVAGGLNRGV